MPITYLKGDATKPIGSGVRIIAHIVNSAGGWGSGFVVALSKRWKAPESRYRKWFKDGTNFQLGATQMVLVEMEDGDILWVCNMIAQVGYGRRGNAKHKAEATEDPDLPPIRYEALEECLTQVAHQAKERRATVHSPRLGAGLSGGSWSVIEKIIEKTLCDVGVEVFVYDPPGNLFNS